MASAPDQGRRHWWWTAISGSLASSWGTTPSYGFTPAARWCETSSRRARRIDGAPPFGPEMEELTHGVLDQPPRTRAAGRGATVHAGARSSRRRALRATTRRVARALGGAPRRGGAQERSPRPGP